LLARVRLGEFLPFESQPPVATGLRRNHPELVQKPAVVWETLLEQLQEKAVLPFDTQGGTRVPKGVAPIRWVSKAGSERVRITINMRTINEYFAPESSSIVLQTLHSQRHKFGLKWNVGFDQHSSYYQHRYRPSERSWLGFSVHDSELPGEAKRYLWKHCGKGRHGQRWVFQYSGLAMGCAPSCRQFSEPMEAIMGHWARYGLRSVSGADAVWDGTSYIDDSAFMIASFQGAVELVLRLLCDYILLGFSLNFVKSNLLPRREIVHLGIRCSSRTRRFTLPPKRVCKLDAAMAALQQDAVVGEPVAAKLVARAVGNLWSIHVVAHHCVALMARASINTLAVALRRPDLVTCTDARRLRALLKQVWAGDVLWTAEAQMELDFWRKTDFASLSAPMSFDALDADMHDFFVHPTRGVLADDVQILAADTSDTASGGGEFLALNGELWQASRMFSPLSSFGIGQSSTYRELEGLIKVTFAVRGSATRRVVLVCDNQATVAILKRGSRIPVLQALAAAFFRQCLSAGVCVFPIWQRRSEKIVAACDDDSRLHDDCAFWLPAHLFWRANAKAKELFGSGFQYDRTSAIACAQPRDCRIKLPYDSRWREPFASGRDCLAQDWRGWVNYCNPPFCLLSRILTLVERQRVVAAVVVPLGTRATWAHKVELGARGVVARLRYRPAFSANTMEGPGGGASASFQGDYAIVFLDFRVFGAPTRQASSAEELVLRARLLPADGTIIVLRRDGGARRVSEVLAC
jgi:hypothetical protein